MSRRFPPLESGFSRGRRGNRDDSADRLTSIFGEHDRLFDEELSLNNDRVTSDLNDLFRDDSPPRRGDLSWPTGAEPDPRSLCRRGRNKSPPLFRSGRLGGPRFDDSPSPKRRGGGSLFDDSPPPERRGRSARFDDNPSPRPNRSERSSLFDDSAPGGRQRSEERSSVFDDSPPLRRPERGNEMLNTYGTSSGEDEERGPRGVALGISCSGPFEKVSIGFEIRGKLRPALRDSSSMIRPGEGLDLVNSGLSDLTSLSRSLPRSGGGRGGRPRSLSPIVGLGRGIDSASRRGRHDDFDDENSRPCLPFFEGRAPPRPDAWD